MQLQSNELLPDLGEVRRVDEFANILNYESSEDASMNRRSIAENLLQSLYDKEVIGQLFPMKRAPHRQYHLLLQIET